MAATTVALRGHPQPGVLETLQLKAATSIGFEWMRLYPNPLTPVDSARAGVLEANCGLRRPHCSEKERAVQSIKGSKCATSHTETQGWLLFTTAVVEMKERYVELL